MNTDLKTLSTEAINPNSPQLDQLSARDIVALMNREDAGVAAAVERELDSIAQAVDLLKETFTQGGRLISLGAGTSGRLGVLDASECPPTFSTDRFIALIAGGDDALRFALEGAEDDTHQVVEDLKQLQLQAHDCVLGIAASGRTPYVIAGLAYARQIGAKTLSLACNKAALISNYADVAMEVEVGPELLSGSTRLKAGTATKMVLNMLSTASMVLMGKVYDNLMVDVRATNDKLKERALNILVHLTQMDEAAARTLLKSQNYQLKRCVVMHTLGIDAASAQARLDAVQGHLRDALKK
jgi:N-acetylmuramic acid 6-phosphate etherase